MGAGANMPPNCNNCTKLLYLAKQKSIRARCISHVATGLVLLEENRTRGGGGGRSAKLVLFFFFKRAFALEGERRAERSAEGQFKWRKAEMSFSDLFAPEIKLYQQAGADRNWIKTFRAASQEYEYHIYSCVDHFGPPSRLL